MSRVIITGAGGFIGSALTQKMINNGIEVVAISDIFNSEFPKSSMVTRINAMINDKEELLKMIPRGEYKAFYHLAWRGVNGPDKASYTIQIDNIRMTLDCAWVAKELGCGKYLCSGTVAENSVGSLNDLKSANGGMMYGIAKHCAHMLLETYCKVIGQNFIWMQFSNIYGPLNKTGNLVSYTLGELTRGNEAIFGPALQPYDFIYVDDLIEAVYRLGIKETNCNCYLLGSGKPRQLKDYLVYIGEACGKPELIKIGIRPDDGIVYTMDMFDNSKLLNDVGDYITAPFEEHIKYTIDNY